MLSRMKARLFGRRYRVIVASPCRIHYATQTVRARNPEDAGRKVTAHYAESGKHVLILRVDEW